MNSRLIRSVALVPLRRDEQAFGLLAMGIGVVGIVVDPEVLGRFLPSWQHVIGSSPRAGLRGLDGVVSAVEQLAGAPVPAGSVP